MEILGNILDVDVVDVKIDNILISKYCLASRSILHCLAQIIGWDIGHHIEEDIKLVSIFGKDLSVAEADLPF